MSILDWAILIGFGVPIVSLCSLFVVCAMQMKKEDAQRG